jgi:hypothetical protein
MKSFISFPNSLIWAYPIAHRHVMESMTLLYTAA